jgi:hypothetical protein
LLVGFRLKFNQREERLLTVLFETIFWIGKVYSYLRLSLVKTLRINNIDFLRVRLEN